MTYTPEEKLKMDRLVKAFEDFIMASRDIDIAYTEKTGYVRLITAEGGDWVYFPIADYDEMLQMFFYDILCEEVGLAVQRNPRLTNAGMDYTVPHNRLRNMLSALDEDRGYAMGELDKFIDSRRQQEKLP